MIKSLARFSLRREILSISCDHEADSAVYPLCQMLGRKVRIALHHLCRSPSTKLLKHV